MNMCDGSCGRGQCACGAVKDGVLQDGRTMRLSLMMKDGATIPDERKALAMMTDSDIRTMRDSVRTMTVDKAAALPIYDSVRGTICSGMSGERYYALLDGAHGSSPEYTKDQARRDASYDHMTDRIGNAYKATPVNDNRSPTLQFARDGRPMSAMSDSERAYEEMVARISNAHKV